MSNIVNINMDGTWATVKTAFETMGFTVTDNSGVYTCYYTADTNAKMYYKLTQTSGTGFTIDLYKSNNRSVGSMSWDYGVALKITYEKIGNTIAFGLCNTNKDFAFGELIIAPVSQEDDWQYIQNTNNWYIHNGRTENSFAMPVAKMRTSSSAIQIVKAYDGGRFMDNVYQTTVNPDIPIYSSSSNAIYASIGENTYRIINIFDNYATRSCLAFKLSS